ncbi:MAG: hypothetical protein Q9162_001711 [Coniocarpon cinnabarinum]
MSHARNSSEVKPSSHPLSLKVLRSSESRLSKPELSHQNPLPRKTTPSLPTIDSRSALSYAAEDPDDSFALSPLLTLPSSFGVLHVGESFACTFCINGELSEGHQHRTVDGVQFTAKIQTPSQPQGLPLALDGVEQTETDGECLGYEESLSRIARFDLREEGTHIVQATVTYKDNHGSPDHAGSNEGQTRSFRKLYQFVAQQLLSVRTKAQAMPARAKRDDETAAAEYVLEAQIENVGNVEVVLQDVSLQPKSYFIARSMNVWDILQQFGHHLPLYDYTLSKMADNDTEMSDQDKIRARRLQKLASNSQPSNQQSFNSSNTDQTPSQEKPVGEPPKPKINITSANGNAVLPSPSNTAPQANPTTTSAPAPRSTSSTRSPSTNNPQDVGKSLEAFEDSTLAAVFRFTLNPNRTTDAHGHPLIVLNGLRTDLEESQRPVRLTTDILGDAIIEAASESGKATPIEYLLGCWKRVSRLWRTHRSNDSTDPKLAIVKEARRMCMSNCIFAVTMPEMFGQDTPQSNLLTPHLLQEPDSEKGVCHEFLQEAVSRFDDDDSVKVILVEAMEQLSQELATKSMNDNYKPYVLAMRGYARFPQLVKALSESDKFLPPNVPAQEIETRTLLGPFFRISPLQGEVAVNYFSSPKTRDRASIVNSQNALRMTLQQHQTELFDIIDRFIKSSKESREKTLDWFALCVNQNHKRRAMRPDPRYLSSHGLMVNLTIVLDMLSEPFMDASFSKIHRIEPEYFRRSPRVDISDETKLNADQATSDAFYAQKAEGTSSFISEIFFLTVAAHHYGTEAANTGLSRMRKDIKLMEQEMQKFEEERKKYLDNPFVLARFDEQLKRFKDRAEKGHCEFLSLEGILLDELSQARSMSFMRYVIVWLMRLASGVEFPKQTPSLPLPSDQPDLVKCLPEYFLEDVVDHFKFVTGHMPHVISPTQCDELIMICITFLRSSDYVRNPYLKSGLVSILFYGTLQTRQHSKGVLGDVLNALPFALKHLLHALMQFYIECESTGAHTQFYDKFNIRYEIFQVIKTIWSNVVYREQLDQQAKTNSDFFIQFVNMLLNDVTYVLDESFTSFNKISTLSRELEQLQGQLDETQKQEKQEALDEAQNKARSYMQLTNESVATLKLFTEALSDAFTSPEVVHRLASMLDYNLESLVGPKQRELKVNNPQEYGFNPKTLLADIMDVYLNLASKPNFHQAIAKDGRSYKPANFDAAAQILGRFGLKSAEELRRWNNLKQKADVARREIEAEDEQMEDAPDEFMDPLMAELMTDPVILPASSTTVDRSTIRQHLLSDPHDPFNRAPLKIEDVREDTELKQKIDEWRKEKRAERLNRMDTSTT